jgi:hypothetical protein
MLPTITATATPMIDHSISDRKLGMGVVKNRTYKKLHAIETATVLTALLMVPTRFTHLRLRHHNEGSIRMR